MDLGIKGKRALVIGGSQGLGLAVSKSLAAEGVMLRHAAATGGEGGEKIGAKAIRIEEAVQITAGDEPIGADGAIGGFDGVAGAPRELQPW